VADDRRGLVSWVCCMAVLAFACDVSSPQTVPEAFDLLVISDSNGESPGAWPDRLADRLAERLGSEPGVRLHNHSEGGRTLSIDRGGPQTFAVRGISSWLAEALGQSDGRIDAIVVALGTNDLQSRFATEAPDVDRVARSLGSVLTTIRREAPGSRVWVASPPPLSACPPSSRIDPRWLGAPLRQSAFERDLKMASLAAGAAFVSLRASFRVPICSTLHSDGVHLNEIGHGETARILGEAMEVHLDL
jgi:lysophospholipase L1-like esterase